MKFDEKIKITKMNIEVKYFNNNSYQQNKNNIKIIKCKHKYIRVKKV